MRRPYYNYWSSIHGDSLPEQFDPSLASWVAPKYITTFSTTDQDTKTLQTVQKKRKWPKINWKYIFLALFIVTLLALICLLIAWGVESDGFKNVYANNHARIQQTTTVSIHSRLCETEPCAQLGAQIARSLDTSTNACDSFYQYVCGRHADDQHDQQQQQHFVTPVSHAAVQRNALLEQLRVVLSEPIRSVDTGSAAMAKLFYSKCTNENVINKLGLAPLKSLLDDFGGWPVLNDNQWTASEYSWEKNNAELIRYLGVQTLIAVSVEPDLYNNSRLIITIDQPGANVQGILRPVAERKKRNLVRSSYLDHMVDLAVTLGADRTKASRQLQDVLVFEALMFNITVPEENRGEFDGYILMSINDLTAFVDSIDWDTWFATLLPRELNIKRHDKIFKVDGLDYLLALEDLLTTTNPRTLANYHMFNLVDEYINYVSTKFQHYGKRHSSYLLQGMSDPERWQRCVGDSVHFLPWHVSALYVKSLEDSNLKDEVELIVTNVQRTMYKKIRQSTWMDDPSRNQALEKLEDLDYYVGYPGLVYNETWIMSAYDKDFRSSSYFESVVNFTGLQVKSAFLRLSVQVNWNEWNVDVYPVNLKAFYGFRTNEIMVPLAMLQTPLMSVEYPRYLQYSRIGYLTGYEMARGFLEKGSHYDEAGNLNPWWSNRTLASYHRHSNCFNPPNTTDQIIENDQFLADLSGVLFAYDAYKTWMKENSVKEEKMLRVLPHIDSKQAFFISFANMWCESGMLDGLEDELVNADRVDTVLRHVADFATTFQCSSTSRMNPIKKCPVF